MRLSFEFDNNGNPFSFSCLSNKYNFLKSDQLTISIDLYDLMVKKNRECFRSLKQLQDNTVLIDKTTNSRYIITSHTIDIGLFMHIFSFKLVSEVEFVSLNKKVSTYNGCTFIDNSVNINDFESYYNQMSCSDAKLLQELINLIVNEKELEKSKLQKFKDMLINNTDILGIIVPIIMEIICK